MSFSWDAEDTAKAAHMLRRRTPSQVARYMGADIGKIEQIARSLPSDRRTMHNGTSMIAGSALDDSMIEAKRDAEAAMGSSALLAKLIEVSTAGDRK